MSTKVPTESTCVVCKGEIIKETERLYDPSTGPMIIGPGSQGQFREHAKFYCGTCGIRYEFLPKKV